MKLCLQMLLVAENQSYAAMAIQCIESTLSPPIGGQFGATPFTPFEVVTVVSLTECDGIVHVFLDKHSLPTDAECREFAESMKEAGWSVSTWKQK